jgi:ABC-type transporter Mla maintaining outer membrane lipid asymmetry permease subunit MlaE
MIYSISHMSNILAHSHDRTCSMVTRTLRSGCFIHHTLVHSVAELLFLNREIHTYAHTSQVKTLLYVNVVHVCIVSVACWHNVYRY